MVKRVLFILVIVFLVAIFIYDKKNSQILIVDNEVIFYPDGQNRELMKLEKGQRCKILSRDFDKTDWFYYLNCDGKLGYILDDSKYYKINETD